MDYTLNAPLFICYLRDYLARRAPGNLYRLLRGEACAEETRLTRLLLNSLQVLLALETRRRAAVLAQPPAAVSRLLADQAAVVSYCLTLMESDWAAELPYGLAADSFAHCGELLPVPPVVRRVRAANHRLLAANEKYISAGPQPGYTATS